MNKQTPHKAAELLFHVFFYNKSVQVFEGNKWTRNKLLDFNFYINPCDFQKLFD